MKLVFYSGGQTKENKALHHALGSLVDRKKGRSFTYIAFCSDGSRPFFRRAIRRYTPYGFSKFRYLTVDQPLDSDEVKRAFESDVIYLAGGNTFYFLKHLRRAGLASKLKGFAKNGGVLAGLSAGGLIMTPTIALAGYPTWDADPNEVELKDLRALGLVDFEFFPHFRNSSRLLKALARYSRAHAHPILTTKDGGGIVVNGKTTTFFGSVNLFSSGEFHKIA